MKIYNYDKVTKEFISETNATESPLEKGKYLVPANATTIKVNAVKTGYTRVFNETKKVWEYVEDNRGMIIYDTGTKQESKVDYLGAIKSGFTKIKPTEFDVWDTKTNAWVIDTVAEQEAQKQSINNAIQNLLDTTAQKYRYDNIMSARSYAGYTNPFQVEAKKLAVWASNCWVKAGQIEANVQSGTIPMPTVAEVLAQMPVYVA